MYQISRTGPTPASASEYQHHFGALQAFLPHLFLVGRRTCQGLQLLPTAPCLKPVEQHSTVSLLTHQPLNVMQTMRCRLLSRCPCELECIPHRQTNSAGCCGAVSASMPKNIDGGSKLLIALFAFPKPRASVSFKNPPVAGPPQTSSHSICLVKLSTCAGCCGAVSAYAW